MIGHLGAFLQPDADLQPGHLAVSTIDQQKLKTVVDCVNTLHVPKNSIFLLVDGNQLYQLY